MGGFVRRSLGGWGRMGGNGRWLNGWEKQMGG